MTFLSSSDEDELKAAFEVGKVHADAVNEARNLVNMPPNILTATKMADYARELAEKYDFEIEVLVKKKWKNSEWALFLQSTKDPWKNLN